MVTKFIETTTNFSLEDFVYIPPPYQFREAKKKKKQHAKNILSAALNVNMIIRSE